MDTPKKEHKINNCTVIIHSPLVEMSDKERKIWFQKELDRKGSLVNQIMDTLQSVAP